MESSKAISRDPTRRNYTYPINTEYSFSGLSSNLNILEGLKKKGNILNVNYSTSHEKFEIEGDHYYFHSPYDLVSKSTADMRSKIGSTRYVLISPRLKMIDKALNDYEPTRRGCYLENERSLYFFKNYTKVNCQLECLANKTLESCGCVQFYMVRTEETRICGVKDMICYKAVENDKENPCECLMKCGEIQYDIEVKQNEFLR